MQNINQKIDKAQSEASQIKSQGVEEYIDNRKVKMTLKQFLVTLGVVAVGFFAFGAIVF